jgi:predicted MFS family arabinose efflux permease
VRRVSERTLIVLIGAVQFVNILDFVMVMPLGPDISRARALAIPASKLGFIAGSYTAAAAVSGLLGSFFLDRFDRRKALATALFGLVVGTAAGGFATGMTSLLAARLFAGAFGGPATSLAFAIVADQVPLERRGKAVGAVMAAFSVATVMGVPIGLALAHWGGWRLPFFAIAGVGLLVNVLVFLRLPPMRAHLQATSGEPPVSLRALFGRRAVRLSYTMTAIVMMGGFLIIPNVSAYVQYNLGFPRARLQWLYGLGGLASFVATRYGGRVVDRFGSFRTGTAGAFLLLAMMFGFFVVPGLVGWRPPVTPFFVGFMLGLGIRNVSYNTLTTKVPEARERARFLSIQSAVQHAATTLGAFVAAQMLSEGPDGSLRGMVRVAALSMALTAMVPPLLRAVERRVGYSSSGAAGKSTNG